LVTYKPAPPLSAIFGFLASYGRVITGFTSHKAVGWIFVQLTVDPLSFPRFSVFSARMKTNVKVIVFSTPSHMPEAAPNS